tara:strand:- start:298 stop:1341 length:1044 start_codon:yes stop_codon:yes gene_type:complete
MITSDKMSTNEKKRGIADVEDPKTPPHKKQKSESMGKLIDELNETVRRLKEVEYIHQLIIKGHSLVENVGNVQFTTHLRRDPKLIEDLKEHKTSIMQEIKSLEIDELCEEINDSPLIRRQEDLISEEELTSTFYNKEYKSEKNHEDLKDMIKMLEHLEELEEQLEEQPRLKYVAESMALAEVSKDSLEGLEGMMGTLAGSTAQRSLYPTKSNGRQEILTMVPKKRQEIEMRRGIEMMRGEIVKYIHTMHLEQELQELPELIELDDEYTMPESLDMDDFPYLDTGDKLNGDGLDALRYFHENPVENLEDKLIQKQEKELQKLREEFKKSDESDESDESKKGTKVMLRL